jgi:hypothetical protein
MGIFLVSQILIKIDKLIYQKKRKSLKMNEINKKTALKRAVLWSHLESNQAPTDYESVALTE